MSNPMTPEERLLRLIRGDKAKKTEPEPSAPVVNNEDAGKVQPSKFRAKRFGGKKQAVPAVFNPEDLIRHGMSEAPKAHRTAIRLLIAALVILWGYIIWQFFFQSEIGFKDLRPEGDKEQAGAISPWSGLRPELSSYLNPVSGRDVFKAFEPEKPTVEGPKGPTLEETMARIALLGIVLDETPQAIIQDRKTQATYYVHQGDNIESVIVEEIKEGVVRFSYQGESFELRI